MIELGKTLREAREAKGYSVSQLAEITHILPQIIENLEKEDFTKIVAPIYGRGFVKLYCETVGLEPQPLVAEFMEIYNGNRPPVIRMKDVEPPAPDVPAPVTEAAPTEPPFAEEPPIAENSPAAEEETVTEEPQPAPEPPMFNFASPPEPTPTFEPPSRPVHEPEPFKPGPDDLPFNEEPSEPKRDYRLPGYSMPDVPRSFLRFGILIAAAAVILALIILSCRALYRATMQMPETSGEMARVEEGKKASPTPQSETGAPKPQTHAPRKPVAVPPLYID